VEERAMRPFQQDWTGIGERDSRRLMERPWWK
jgi:hypothetical protein